MDTIWHCQFFSGREAASRITGTSLHSQKLLQEGGTNKQLN
jgi:hypothetical protein